MGKKPKRYIAASIPRTLRQQRLAYLDISTIIGTRHQRGKNGGNLVFDVIMLPELQFMRMKSNLSIQQLADSSENSEEAYEPTFVMKDAKTVIAPVDAVDQEAFARNYFIKAFGLVEWAEGAPAPKTKPASRDEQSVVDVDFTVVRYDKSKDKQGGKDKP